jgi:hypothetical protein
MKYCFTTLAVNEPYESITPEFYSELRENTTECEFFITTTNPNLQNQGERIHTKLINPPLYDSRGGFNFNLNLKCLSLKHVLEHEKETGVKPEYVIFTDGDWRMYHEFKEEKVLKMLDAMENEGLDFLFERPAPIGPHKLQPEQSFFRDKLYDYDIFDHNKWDDAHVVNEQFLVFKNNSKFKFFVQRWEQFLWYSIANDIRNYPDGFEIGISALEADMKYSYQGMFTYIQNCFFFYTKMGDYHVRF